MTDIDDAIESRLSRLAAETKNVGPTPGFEARVHQALLTHQEATLWSGILRQGRLGIAAAVIAAAAAVVLAVQSERVYDSEVAVTYGAVELGW